MSFRTRPKGSEDGYTFIEVMMAVSVMMVGAVGIVGLQQTATVGNRHARQMETANQITRTWLERMELDARSWTSVGDTTTTTFITGNTPALDTDAGVWFSPAGNAFDFQGQPQAGAAPTHYCTNVRLQWVSGQRGLRVDVRTWWNRHAPQAAISNPAAFITAAQACAAPGAVTAELAAAVPRLHAVYASTVVRWNNTGQI